MAKKVLMHTCCAPCSVYCIDSLREENIEPTIFWYNPNIHPYIEYKTRRDCLKDYCKKIGAESVFIEEYGLDEFCKNVVSDLENRCVNYCYKKRLTKAVEYAKEHGYGAFTTTLLVSPYQKHEELKKVCKELSALYGVEFLYRDFRVGFREGQKKAREMGLYMQKYCGCIFSEEDRYKKQINRDLTMDSGAMSECFETVCDNGSKLASEPRNDGRERSGSKNTHSSAYQEVIVC